MLEYFLPLGHLVTPWPPGAGACIAGRRPGVAPFSSHGLVSFNDSLFSIRWLLSPRESLLLTNSPLPSGEGFLSGRGDGIRAIMPMFRLSPNPRHAALYSLVLASSMVSAE